MAVQPTHQASSDQGHPLAPAEIHSARRMEITFHGFKDDDVLQLQGDTGSDQKSSANSVVVSYVSPVSGVRKRPFSADMMNVGMHELAKHP